MKLLILKQQFILFSPPCLCESNHFPFNSISDKAFSLAISLLTPLIKLPKHFTMVIVSLRYFKTWRRLSIKFGIFNLLQFGWSKHFIWLINFYLFIRTSRVRIGSENSHLPFTVVSSLYFSNPYFVIRLKSNQILTISLSKPNKTILRLLKTIKDVSIKIPKYSYYDEAIYFDNHINWS